MGFFKDITGQRFGKLVVIRRVENNPDGHARWLCKCDCGNETIVLGRDLRRGETKSCSCLRADSARKNNTTHGKSKSRLYHIWNGMKERCNNVNSKDFLNYGGRGISVCQEWVTSFVNFYEWAMSNGYQSNLSIDRIDVNGNYEPSNCRWATSEVQANNTRVNAYITYKGKTQSLKMWCKELKVNYYMALSRYQDHPEFSPDQIFAPSTRKA